ncbi:MAG TPA: hypothetical protein VKT82_05760 [Ktedonobacterales bacterium]|nr:hypothetical protein [Ktedonobacterales bacterium]
MQMAPANAHAPGWRKRGRILLLGVALTLPPDLFWILLLTRVFLSLSDSFPLLPISALFYLLIPGIEGFLIAKQSGEGCSGADRGCLVGTISALAFVVATAALLIFTIPYYTGSTRGSGLFIGLALAAVLLHAMGCTFGGLLGGLIGGLLGRRYAAAASQRSGHAKNEAS